MNEMVMLGLSGVPSVTTPIDVDRVCYPSFISWLNRVSKTSIEPAYLAVYYFHFPGVSREPQTIDVH